MPTMRYQSNAAWTNYHYTVGKMEAGGAHPQMRIESLGSIEAEDLNQASGLERFAATAATLFGHLRSLEVQLQTSKPFAAGMAGAAWSFAPLTGTPISQLCCGGLSGTTELAPDEWHSDCG